MFRRTKVCVGVLAALGGGLLATTAGAQTAERVEVTGSRLKSFDVETASPIVTIGQEQIKVEGVRSVEQLLNNLPQVFADYGGQVSNGASGTATVNLRNMGRDRTLVLVNGRRLPAGSPRLMAPDVNQVPVPLIKRVEVLTGGASAVYGSDAVAGVVNFIMNDRFEGVEFQANHAWYNHSQNGDIDYALNAAGYPKPGNITSDGEVTDASVTLGGNFANGKGNATVFFGYKTEKALLQSERDFSACSLAPAGDIFSCGGSNTTFPGRFRGIGLPSSARDFTLDKTSGAVRPYNTSTDLYNFGPLNYFQRPSERFSGAAFARYDINDKARAYLETSFHDDRTVAQIAPSGLFGVQATISDANPLLTNDWRNSLQIPAGGTRDVLFNRRNVEGGGRQDDVRHTSYRIITGVKGDVGAWSYDAFAQMGKVVYQETYKNDFSIARSTRALDVITDPNTGQPACRSAVDGTDPNCVPYNIWKLNGVTQGALDYLQTPGFQKGFTSQKVIGINGAVDLGAYGMKMSGASTGAGLAFGYEHRQEKMELSTDTAFTTGDLAGQGGPTIGVGGGYTVKELFGEFKLPIMEKQPYAELLNFNASYRYSSYSTDVSANAYGLGMEWAPNKTAKLRGSVQRSVRAANIVELYSPQALGLYNNDNDPCAEAVVNGRAQNGTGATFTECQRTGVTAAQFGSIDDNPAGQYNAIFGGNTKLNPETGNSYTVGIVLTPMKDLTMSFDYFDIRVKDAIAALDPTVTLAQCLASNNPFYCSKIQRDQFGTLWSQSSAFIQATNFNIGKQATSGLDIGADYRWRLESQGALDFSLLGTWLRKLEVEPIAGVVFPGTSISSYDCAGLYGSTCGTPTPTWRHKFRTTWTTPWDFSVAATWRYIGAVDAEATSSNPFLAGTPNNVDKQFGAMNYIDLAGSYNVNKNVTLRLAINNLFDKDPPLSNPGAPFGNGNTYPVVYDALGRRFSLNLTATF